MQIAVVYESCYGNTEAVAQAVVAGLRDSAPEASIALLRADQADAALLEEATLVVVGAPTHAFRLSTPWTRNLARAGPGHSRGASTSAADRADQGLREWLDRLPQARAGTRAAAFDTRLGTLLPGSAARAARRRLRRLGYRVDTAPAGFIVESSTGPLAAGELDRARLWASRLLTDPVTESTAGSGTGDTRPLPTR